MLRKALQGLGGSNSKNNKKSHHHHPPSSVALSNAQLQRDRDKGSREIKQLQANNSKHHHNHHHHHRHSNITPFSAQDDHHSSRSNASNSSHDSQQYTAMTYTHSNTVGSHQQQQQQNHHHQRVKQFCEYIQTFCLPVEGRYMIMKVERLLLQPQPVQDETAAQHILTLLEKFETLLQAAGIDHFEWVEFTASRTMQHQDSHDGTNNGGTGGRGRDGDSDPTKSTLLKLNLTQFMLELDRLCSDLHFEKLSESDSHLLFYVIAKGNLGAYLGFNGGYLSSTTTGGMSNIGSRANSMLSMLPLASFSSSRSYSESGDSPDPAPSPIGSKNSSSPKLPRTFSSSMLSQVYVDHCNLDITFKKYHSYVMRLKKLTAVYHQLLDISRFMRKMKIRLVATSDSIHKSSSQTGTTNKVILSNRNSVYSLNGMRTTVKLPEIEKLVNHIILEYDAYVREHGPIDATLKLVPIEEILSAGVYDENIEDPNEIFFEDNPIPEPAPPAPMFSFSSKSGSQRAPSMRKHNRSSSFSVSFKSAVSALSSLVPSIGLSSNSRQIYPSGSFNEEENKEMSSSTISLKQRLQEDKDLEKERHHLPRLLSEGVMGGGENDEDSVQSFKYPSKSRDGDTQDTEIMNVEDMDEGLNTSAPESKTAFGINNEFVGQMDKEEREQFDKFLKNMLEGDHRHKKILTDSSTGKRKIGDAEGTTTTTSVDAEKELEEAKRKDIRKRYHVLKVSTQSDKNGDNDNEKVKHVSDVLPFVENSDNSYSKDSTQLSRENSGWIYLNWSGKLTTGFSDRYLNRSSNNLNKGGNLEVLDETVNQEETATFKSQATVKNMKDQEKEQTTILQSFNARVSRARSALLKIK